MVEYLKTTGSVQHIVNLLTAKHRSVNNVIWRVVVCRIGTGRGPDTWTTLSYTLNKPIFSQSAVGSERHQFSTNIATRFLTRLEKSKIVFLPVLCLRPRLQSLPCSNKPLRHHFLNVFGVSIIDPSNFTPLASRVRHSPCVPPKILFCPLLVRL